MKYTQLVRCIVCQYTHVSVTLTSSINFDIVGLPDNFTTIANFIRKLNSLPIYLYQLNSFSRFWNYFHKIHMNFDETVILCEQLNRILFVSRLKHDIYRWKCRSIDTRYKIFVFNNDGCFRYHSNWIHNFDQLQCSAYNYRYVAI